MKPKEKIFYVTGLRQSSLKQKKPDWIVCGSRAIFHNGRRHEITVYHQGLYHCRDGKEYPQNEVVQTGSWGFLPLPWMVKVTDKGDIIQVHLIGYEYGVTEEQHYYGFRYDEPFHNLLSINTRTGQTYFMPYRIKRDGEWEQRGSITRMPMYIKPCHYLSSYEMEKMLNMMSETIVDYILNLIMRKKSRYLGFRPQIYKWSCDILRLIISANAYPLCMPAFGLAGSIDENAMHKIRTSSNILDSVMKYYDVSGKRYNKLFFEKPEVFTSIEHIRHLNLGRDNEFRILQATDQYNCVKGIHITSFIRYICRLEDFYKDKTIIVRRLLNPHCYSLSDTFNMLDQLNSALEKCRIRYGTGEDDPFENETSARLWLKRMYMSSFSKKVHDHVASVFALVKAPRVDIFYTHEEQKLEESNGDFTIHLPKTNHVLTLIGSEMNICVGSYSRDALNKNCTILYVTDAMDEKVACLELRENRVQQVKGVSDRWISEPALSAFLYGWMERHHLDCGNCLEFNGPAAAPRKLTNKKAVNHAGIKLLDEQAA